MRRGSSTSTCARLRRRRRAAPRGRASSCRRRARRAAPDGGRAVERVDARREQRDRSGAGAPCRVRWPSARGPVAWPSSMVTTDPLAPRPAFFGEPGEVAPDVFMHPAFVNTYAVRTPDGLVLIDPGFGHTSRRRARGGTRMERRRPCEPPSTRTATRITPSGCGHGWRPASAPRSSRRRPASRGFTATGSCTA